MIKSIYFIVIVAISISTSCDLSEEIKTFKNFEIKKEFSFNAPIRALSINIAKLVEINNNPFLMCYFFKVDTLFFYSIYDNHKDFRIPLDKYIYSIKDIAFKNIDSIYILIVPLTNFNDSAIVLINKQGKIVESFGIYHEALLTRNNEKLKNNIPVLFNEDTPFDTLNNIKFMRLWKGISKIADNKIFFTTYREYGSFGGYELKLPLIGYFDIKEKKQKFSTDVFFPNIKNKYYSDGMYNLKLFEYDNSIYMLFPFIDIIYKLDYELNLKQSFSIKSKLFDKVSHSDIPLLNQNNIQLFNNFNYLDMFYHKNHFFRVVSLPSDSFGNEYVLYLFADKNFKYLGESIIQHDGFFYKYSNDTIILFSKLYNNKLYIRFCEINEYENCSLDSLIYKLNKISNKNKEKLYKEKCNIPQNTSNKNNSNLFLNYLNKLNIFKENAVYTILKADGCVSCNIEIINFVSINQSFFSKKSNFYLVYVNPNTTMLENKRYLSSFNLNRDDFCIIDTTSLYKYANPKDYSNPRLIVIKNGKIQIDSTFLPSNIEGYYEEVLKINF